MNRYYVSDVGRVRIYRLTRVDNSLTVREPTGGARYLARNWVDKKQRLMTF
jgi:hypothetical protein